LLKSKVDFSHNFCACEAVIESYLGAECGAWDAHYAGKYLPCLDVVIVNRLFAKDCKVELLLDHQMLQNFGNSEGLQILVGRHICDYVDARISAHRKCTSDHVYGSKKF